MTLAASTSTANAAHITRNLAQRFIPKTTHAPAGFRLSAVHAGIRTTSTDPDVVLLHSTAPCTAAGIFTKNKFPAAPVLLCKDILRAAGGAGVQTLVVNAGCANAVTGTVGTANAEEMSRLAVEYTTPSDAAALPHGQRALVMSTGVIGRQLPMEKIRAGISEAAAALLPSSHTSWMNVARGIMTTDMFPKLRSRTCTLPSGRTFSVAGVAKGAGMIHPDMATMLSILCTDARVRPNVLCDVMQYAGDRSWNSVTVDGDTSTNDSAVIFANGASPGWGNDGYMIGDDGIADVEVFRDVIAGTSQDLAQLIARDGEGATKFITVRVTSAASYAQAHTIARTIATSALVKTAMYGRDPNWGRVLAAIGRSPAVPEIDPSRVSLAFGNAELVRCGQPVASSLELAEAVLQDEEVEVLVDLGQGADEATVWTCDFSHEYVSINADYTT